MLACLLILATCLTAANQLEAWAPSPPGGTLQGELFIRHDPQTCKHGLPFLDLADGRRFDGRGRVVDELAAPARPPIRTGYGLPCTLSWPRPSDTVAQLLSYRQGDQVVRRDVTCLTSREVAFRAPVRDCTVESLCSVPGEEGVWCSHLQHLQVDVRGVFPFAGNPAAAGDHQDGPGASARFREAFDAARIPVASTWSAVRWDLLVTDPVAHVLRRVTPEGVVSTFSGEPDQAGHQDSPGLLQRMGAVWSRQPAPRPRFNRPTYLAARKFPGIYDWEVLVSDSGNHVVRRVGLDGQVDTLAGAPAQAGHHDADDPRQALFNDPRGIAVDPEGNAFVADRGNQVIRRIARGGQVTTLAGSPGQPGTADGIGRSARFTALTGLAWKGTGDRGGILFALDGHAVRAVSLPDGVVATVLGQVDAPGFRDAPPGEPGSLALRRPCLRNPAGIRCRGGEIQLADTGNHAIRRADLEQATLLTVAGDPQAPETRWGLLRDGIPGALGPGYAALEAPTALVGRPPGPEGPLLVCAGRGLAEIRDGCEERDTVSLAEVECRPENRIGSRTMMVVFRALACDHQQRSMVRAIHYSVDFLDPGGALACRREGQGFSGLLVMVQGAFTQSGQGAVVIRCATEEGVSAGAQVRVPVGCQDSPGTVPRIRQIRPEPGATP